MILRRILLENFRKFREPHEVSGLGDGLNILIAPNETGKSTVLEAVRAALFLRHGSKTQLIQSFLPYGDSVGPEVQLDFEIDGAPYSLTKRFLAKATAELEGPNGRQQGDAAEEALQELLGFDKQSNRFDSGALGSLGLLWVPQSEGLSLPTPGDRVREGISSALEDQAGALLGSVAFERVRDRIETQYDRFRTATGKSRGELKNAETHVEEAEEALQKAEQKEAALEQAFAELERKKGELQLVVNELADEEDKRRRRQLEADLETAKGAAQKLETVQARHATAKACVVRLEDLSDRRDAASKRLEESRAALEQLTKERATLADALSKAKRTAAKRSEELKVAREKRDTANKALARARRREAQRRTHSDVARARERHRRLVELEAEQNRIAEQAGREVPAEIFDKLESLEAQIASERNTLQAGGVRVEYRGSTAPTINGKTLTEGGSTLTQETTLAFADGGELTVHPPSGLAGAEARLASFENKREAILSEWAAAALTDLRQRDREARDAKAQLSGVVGQIETLTAADPALDLAAGADALKLFIAEHPEEVAFTDADQETGPSISQMEDAADESEAEFARAEERNELALDALRQAENEDGEIAARKGAAESDCERARAELARFENQEDFVKLTSNLVEARAQLARCSDDLEQAQRNAGAFDKAAIAREIETIDRQREKTGERRSTLREEVSRLEARIEIEGGQGLAERTALARSKADAARSALSRVQDEANTLTLLRDVLAKAQEETSRSLVGPVATRARSYMQRILPGLDPVYGSGLELDSVRRGGVKEDRELLSQGTQEQLALLSRLAFAEMLRDEGWPVSLMLDDPLAYSDDYRLQTMIDLLDESARSMQVVILSCRDRAFRAAPGKKLELREAS